MIIIRKLAVLACVLGAAVASRPSSAATPPIRAGLQLGLAADDIDTADPAEVEWQGTTPYVKDWRDSGLGHATQANPANRPVYIPQAINSWPAVQFDGTNDYLSTTVPQITGDKSIFIVHKRTSTQLGTEISSTVGTSGMFLADSWGGDAETEGRLYVAHDLQVPPLVNSFILKSYILSGSNGTLKVNGTKSTATTPDAASGNYTLSDPYTFFFRGQIAEVLIYNRALSDPERQSVENYLAEKYSVGSIPPPITDGLRLRLAADAIHAGDPSQVVQQNGTAYVKDWLDVSGNNLHATQVASDRQPAYVPAALNGKPVLQFDGKNDFLTTTLPQISGDKSIFIVHKRVGTQLRTEISSSAGNSGMFLANAYGTGAETEGRLSVAQDLQLPGLLNSFVLKTYIRSGATGKLMVNDASTSATVPDSAAGTYTISDGYNWSFSGQIAEVLVYNRALTEVERQSTENYLAEKYALWEQTLPSQGGLQSWLTADAVNTDASYQNSQVRAANGTLFVTTWPDRSAYTSFDATQPLPDNQPQYLTNALNKRPVIRFDGANDYLATKLPQIVGDKSIFVVQRRIKGSPGNEISSTGTAGHFLGDNNPAAPTESKGHFLHTSDLQLPWSLYQFVIKSFIRKGPAETLRFGDAIVSANLPDAAGGNYSISDSRWPFWGDIAEVLIYNRALTDIQRNSIETYLADKWSYVPNSIMSVPPDLWVPPVTNGVPARGLRVKQTSPEYAGTNAYHGLYLPIDWQPGRKYPVIVEYSPNAGYNDWGIYTTNGSIEEQSLGYGISGGQGFIWVSMPTIGGSPLSNQAQWWGDLNATKDYCLKTIRHVCEDYGGDPSAVILTGFSRGAAACNYIGLNDDTIADAWLAFIPHSGYDYDGEYPSDTSTTNAAARLQKLKGRSQHLSQGSQLQGSWETSWKYYLLKMGVNMAPFTFRSLPFQNHTSLWAERPVQLRRDVRAWVQQTLLTHPGTHSIRGRITDTSGAPLAGVRIQSGYTHFTFSDSAGIYELAGLIDSDRTVTALAANKTFTSQSVTIAGRDVGSIDFRSNP